MTVVRTTAILVTGELPALRTLSPTLPLFVQHPTVSSEFQEDQSTKCVSELFKPRTLPKDHGSVTTLMQLHKMQVVPASTEPVARQGKSLQGI